MLLFFIIKNKIKDDFVFMPNGYTLILPFPPSVNHYLKSKSYLSKRTGKPVHIHYLPTQTQNFYEVVKYSFIQQKGISYNDQKLRVEIDLHPPNNKPGRPMDLDNALKCVLDSLQKAGAFNDDNNIWSLLIERKCEIEDGELKVKIYPI